MNDWDAASRDRAEYNYRVCLLWTSRRILLIMDVRQSHHYCQSPTHRSSFRVRRFVLELTPFSFVVGRDIQRPPSALTQTRHIARRPDRRCHRRVHWSFCSSRASGLEMRISRDPGSVGSVSDSANGLVGYDTFWPCCEAEIGI